MRISQLSSSKELTLGFFFRRLSRFSSRPDLNFRSFLFLFRNFRWFFSFNLRYCKALFSKSFRVSSSLCFGNKGFLFFLGLNPFFLNSEKLWSFFFFLWSFFILAALSLFSDNSNCSFSERVVTKSTNDLSLGFEVIFEIGLKIDSHVKINNNSSWHYHTKNNLFCLFCNQLILFKKAKKCLEKSNIELMMEKILRFFKTVRSFSQPLLCGQI